MNTKQKGHPLADLMMEYAEGNVGLAFLEKRYPFLAREIVRQQVQDNIGSIFRKLN